MRNTKVVNRLAGKAERKRAREARLLAYPKYYVTIQNKDMTTLKKNPILKQSKREDNSRLLMFSWVCSVLGLPDVV